MTGKFTLVGLGVAACLALLSCGGGGGGGDSDSFVGAANVSIRVNPSDIDTGDRMLVSMDISEVHPIGIILKVRYPRCLSYVLNSATLTVDESEVDIGPAVNSADDRVNYLVFFLSQSSFNADRKGKISFQLEGNARVSEGQVEVDADVDDPLIDNTVEFDIENPEFGAEDSAMVEVRG